MAKFHYICDFFSISKKIDNIDFWQPIVKQICSDIGVNIVKMEHHMFQSQGLTLVFILSESHIAIHTWPEEDYAAVELFSCKPINDPLLIFRKVTCWIGSQKGILRIFERGIYPTRRIQEFELPNKSP